MLVRVIGVITLPKVDLINLPYPYQSGPPPKENNCWNWNPEVDEGNLAQLEELEAVHNALVDLLAEGLTGDDLLRVWTERRVNPLQKRSHNIWQMSGVMDPNRMSTFPLSKESVCRRVRAIAQTKMTPNWEWGKEPYTRENPPPSVRIRSNSSYPNVLTVRSTF